MISINVGRDNEGRNLYKNGGIRVFVKRNLDGRPITSEDNIFVGNEDTYFMKIKLTVYNFLDVEMILNHLGFTLSVEDDNFRARRGLDYYYVDNFGEIAVAEEDGDTLDDKLFNIGNYFKTEEDALNSPIYKSYDRR